MKRAFLFLPAFVAGALATSLAVNNAPAVAAGPPPSKAGTTSDAPTLGSIAPMLEGFRWGMTKNEVLAMHNGTNGIFDKDFDPQLARVQPGVQQKALENARDNLKAALVSSWIEFKETPRGYDATGLRTEYSYRNNEALLSLDRNGKKRYFFFIGAPPTERLWKIYDEIAVGENSPLGKTFQEAVTKLQGALGVAGRVRSADAAQGLSFTTVDWQDGSSHMRAVDRTGSSHLVAVVFEERNTLNNIDRMRANKAEDPLAMDPSISAITKGGISDPSSQRTAPAASGSGKPAGSKPPKK